MRNQTILVVVIMVLLLSVCANGRYSGGTGEPNDPYLTATAEDLNDIGNHPEDFNKCFLMVADINLADYTGTEFNIIGDWSNRFTGIFDGNDHRIWNFSFSSFGRFNIGLFRCVDRDGQIKNLGMENVDVNDINGNHVGGLVGYNRGTITNCYCTANVFGGVYNTGGLVGYNGYGGTISDCYAIGYVTGAGDYIGGLVGTNNGTVSNCYATASVSGPNDTAGLVGHNCHGTISNSYATGSVSGDWITGGLVGHNCYGAIENSYATASVSGDKYVGGLVGRNYYYQAMVSNCYATGSVEGNSQTGGLVGHNCCGTISNSYATGSVSGDWKTGGLVGNNWDGAISNCYATGSVEGKSITGGLVGTSGGTVSTSFWDIETGGPDNGIGTPKTTAEMQTESTFTEADWDFIDIWDLTCEGMNYPRFIWQITPVDYLCPHGVDFKDYSFFADYWLDNNCGEANDCDGTDLDFSDTVDANDLKIFCGYWLEGL